jgi:hypothetical protein
MKRCAAQALASGALRPLADHLAPQQLAWLQGHLAPGPPPAALASPAPGSPTAAGARGERRADITLLADMLAGGSERGREFSPSLYGCLLAFAPVRPAQRAHSVPSLSCWSSAAETHIAAEAVRRCPSCWHPYLCVCSKSFAGLPLVVCPRCRQCIACRAWRWRRWLLSLEMRSCPPRSASQRLRRRSGATPPHSELLQLKNACETGCW